ncbi:MAG: hypothetical protein M5U28_43535 [Sandaracinaceae bacterium]|nr:hypothetical protein [Sandaracinaceae bacterium]
MLGAGDTEVAFSEPITGLSPATTYYYCAIASNAEGTSFGAVLTFTTEAAPPTVTTAAPTDVMADSAVLNGAADPNGEATTAWFRFDTTDPGECDDTFGTRAPASGGAAVGDGVDPVAYSELITGLTPGVVYYCAIAESALGVAFGEIVTFSPGAIPPTVTTEVASTVEATSAVLAGTANPNGTEATGWFRYGQVDPGVCDDAFGTRAPAAGGAALGAGTAATAFEERRERPLAGVHLLLLRGGQQPRRRELRRGPLVHDARGAAHRHHGDADRRLDGPRHALRHGAPAGHGHDGVVPLRLRGPGRVRRLLRHARPGRGRLRDRRGPSGGHLRPARRRSRRRAPTTCARSG